MKAVRVFGDKHFLRPTSDIIDYVGGICGFDIFNKDKSFLFHWDGDSEKQIVSEIKWRIYRRFAI